MQEKSLNGRLKTLLEVLAIVGPILCLVDCIVIPLAILLLPLIGIHHVFHGIGDQLLAVIVLLICAPVIIPGFLKHRKKRVLALMALGFGMIFFASLAGETSQQHLHIVFSIAGSLMLIRANSDNKRFSKSAGKVCCDHGHV